MAVYVLTVAGATKAVQEDSVDIRETANSRNLMNCAIKSLDGTYRPALRAEVILTEDGTRIFGGNVDAPSEQGIGRGANGSGPEILTSLSISDFNALADRRQVTEEIPAGTLKAALLVLEPYLTDYGVTLHASQANGPALPALSYVSRKLTEVFDELSALTNYEWTWNIDYTKVLRMVEIGTAAAPFNVTDANGVVEGDITVEPSTTDYANSIILLAGTGQKEVTDDFVGDGVEDTFPLNYTLVSDRGYVTNGAANEPLGPGATWEYDSLTNTITRTSPPANLNAISITYTAQFPMRLTADGGAAPADLVEKTYVNEAIFDRTVGQALADALLARDMATPKIVHYTTAEVGIHPGQTQTITSTKRNLSGEFLITDVQIATIAGHILRRRVTAVSGGTIPASWRETIKAWSGASGASSAAASVSIVTSGGVGGSGTAGTIPIWATAATLGDSLITQSGGTVTVTGTLAATTFSGSGASLTAIPETAITDGAILARVGATETISGAWTFTGIPTISSTEPILYFFETDQGADLKRTRFDVQGGVLSVQTVDDAGSSVLATILTLSRAGAFATAGTITTLANVGAGTSAPHLRGEVKAAGAGLPAVSGSTQTGIFRLSQGAGTGVVDFGFGGSSGAGWIQATQSSNLANTFFLLLNPNGGNVGIGSAADPANTLDVTGTLGVSGLSVLGTVLPTLTDTYDLGRYDRIWNQAYISQLNAIVFALNTQTLFGGYSTIGKQAGSFAAAVGSGDAAIDFGQTMTVGDFVLVRAADTAGTVTAEYVQVGSHGAGNVYAVTRNLSGGGAKNWAAGVPYLVLGSSGDGRIDLLAYDGKPRMLMVTQGATYNAQNVRMVVGNLDTFYGYASSIYGTAIGDPAAANITIDPTNGIRIRHGTTNKIVLDASGNASFTGTVTAAAGTIGGWTIGATTLVGADATLYSVGAMHLGTGNNILWMDATHATYRLWIGNALPGSAALAVTKGGVMTAVGAIFTGPDITVGSFSSFNSAGAVKFARDTTFDANQIFGLWAQGSGSAYQDLVLENHASRSGIGAAPANVYLRAQGWNSAGDVALTQAEIRLRSEVSNIAITLSAPATFVTGTFDVTTSVATFANGLIMSGGDIVPSADNTRNVGLAGTRFTLVRAVTITPGDLTFDNGWTITESDKVGIAEKGLAILDETGELVSFIGKSGFKRRGRVVLDPDDVDGLPFVPTTAAQRAQMDATPELRFKTITEPVLDREGNPVLDDAGVPRTRTRQVPKTAADVLPMPDPVLARSRRQRLEI